MEYQLPVGSLVIVPSSDLCHYSLGFVELAGLISTI